MSTVAMSTIGEMNLKNRIYRLEKRMKKLEQPKTELSWLVEELEIHDMRPIQGYKCLKCSFPFIYPGTMEYQSESNLLKCECLRCGWEWLSYPAEYEENLTD